jgi:hypothetical protein
MYPALPIDSATALQAVMTLLALVAAGLNYLLYIRA